MPLNRILLSDKHQAFAEGRVASGLYDSISEYINALIVSDAKAQSRLEALLLEGLEDEGEEWTEADWQALLGTAEGRNAEP